MNENARGGALVTLAVAPATATAGTPANAALAACEDEEEEEEEDGVGAAAAAGCVSATALLLLLPSGFMCDSAASFERVLDSFDGRTEPGLATGVLDCGVGGEGQGAAAWVGSKLAVGGAEKRSSELRARSLSRSVSLSTLPSLSVPDSTPLSWPWPFLRRCCGCGRGCGCGCG